MSFPLFAAREKSVRDSHRVCNVMKRMSTLYVARTFNLVYLVVAVEDGSSWNFNLKFLSRIRGYEI